MFSIAATWVVLGREGIRQFSRMREKAIERIIEEQRSGRVSQRNMPDLTPGDYFHDGREVLPDVKSWHNILRTALRRTDSITNRVLDLVEQKMLLGNPEDRIKAKGICKELKDILTQSQKEARIKIPEIILTSLFEVESEAEERVSIATIRQLEQALTASSDRQDRKSKLQSIPIMKTTHRSEYLKSALEQMTSGTIYESPTEADVSAAAGQAQAAPYFPPTPERWPTRSQLIDAQISAGNSYPTSTSASMTPGTLKRAKTSKPGDPKDVWQTREEIEKRGSLFGIKKSKKDEVLTRYFRDRDLVSRHK